VTDRYESLIEQQIRLAQERGDFDDLPGSGKPLPDRGEREDELWWVRDYLRREGLSNEALLPTALQLARQLERLQETAGKLKSEQAVRALVAALNRRIEDYLRAPSGPHVAVKQVDVDRVVEQWHESRPPPAPPPVREEPPRRRWGRKRER
jgi:hypothetical protein